MFENYRVFKTDLAGKPISFEVGKMCGLSNGSCLVRYGETTLRLRRSRVTALIFSRCLLILKKNCTLWEKSPVLS